MDINYNRTNNQNLKADLIIKISSQFVHYGPRLFYLLITFHNFQACLYITLAVNKAAWKWK